ncbi:MAG: hypothetical protein WBD54_09920 [Candidatus Acidiferrales bacterium]
MKMPRSKKVRKNTKKALDTHAEKRGRGRPRWVDPGETKARGDNYQGIFNMVWDTLYPLLSKAQTDEEVIRSFEEGAGSYSRHFMPKFAPLVLKVLRERTFPKKGTTQANFMADSLAAYGDVSARRSRDICQQERLKGHKTHHIIRYDFKIECSCGYKGFSRDHACPRCKAKVEFEFHSMLSQAMA